jgi:hypothetical protein
VRPAIVTVAEREVVVVFGWTVSTSVELPVPEVADRVAHDTLEAAVNPQPAPVVTAMERVPPAAAMLPEVGEMLNVHGTPAACETVTDRPPTVTVALRPAGSGLGLTVTVTDPGPLPDAGLAVAQDAPLEAVQLQPASVVRLTLAVPPAAGSVSAVGEAVKVHAAPACVTVTVRPATVTVPVRELDVVLAATVSVTDPFPVPDAGLTVIQAVPLEAVHAQLAAVATATDALPAPAATDSVAGEAEKVQPPRSMVNWFDTAERPVPLGPTAATRDS